jgi:hypothetical protein
MVARIIRVQSGRSDPYSPCCGGHLHHHLVAAGCFQAILARYKWMVAGLTSHDRSEDIQATDLLQLEFKKNTDDKGD